MTLGEFREETKNVPDDTILDDVQFIEDLPGYYDGYPINCKESWTYEYINHRKIRFHCLDLKTLFWDTCYGITDKDECKKKFMEHFIVHEGVSEERKLRWLNHIESNFEEHWISEEWVSYRNKKPNYMEM